MQNITPFDWISNFNQIKENLHFSYFFRRHRPKEGPGEAAGRRIRGTEQGGDNAEAVSARRQPLPVCRQQQDVHRLSRRAEPEASRGPRQAPHRHRGRMARSLRQ